MTQYDVFNGDADGICALHQLRLAEPRPAAHLITGVKRDIKLLSRLLDEAANADEITVLDISMSSNQEALNSLLARGCKVFYADHHFSGDIPDSHELTAHIDASPEVCTSLIIDRLLVGRYRPWAVAAAFGDNLHDAAGQAARSINLSDQDSAVLQELGELLNYNGYGGSLSDLHFHPGELFAAVHQFEDPFEFFYRSQELSILRNGFWEDMKHAHSHGPEENAAGRIYRFPAAPWSKRAAGVFINEKAREQPAMAHDLLVDNGDGTLRASVRAPLANKQGADLLCLAFPTGGGRKGAAGINALPKASLAQFVSKFIEVFSR